MTVKPIRIEIITSCISDLERIVETVKKLRKSKKSVIKYDNFF